MKRSIIGLCAASAAVFAGCGGPTYQAPGPCEPPAGVTTTLVYPAPGATGIPDAFGLVVLGSTSALPAGYNAYVVNSTTQNGVGFNGVGTPPNPLPTPDAIPTFANPSYQASGNPGATFVAGSTIAVYLNDTFSRCVPTVSLGSFRVQ